MRLKNDDCWGQLKRGTSKSLARVKINGSESRILWAIVHKTISYNKLSDYISESQFLEMTGISTWHQDKQINSLIKKGVIFGKDRIYGLCKEFLVFEATPKQEEKKRATPNQEESTPKQDGSYPQTGVYKRSSQEKKQKKGLSTSRDKDQLEINKRMVSVMKENLANMKGMK